MFLWKLFTKNRLNDRERQEQRKLLYSGLRDHLQCVPFELILPVAQLLDPNNLEGTGYCHGYNDAWTHEVVELALQSQPITKWDALIQVNGEASNGIRLTDRIRQANGKHHCAYFPGGKNHSKAQHFHNTNELLYSATEHIVEAIAQKNNLIALDLASMPTLVLQNNTISQYFEQNPGKVKKWHELRFYIDESERLHFFDANLGWLTSKAPNPSQDNINAFLNIIFMLLQYDDYSILSVHSLNLQKNRVQDSEPSTQEAHHLLSAIKLR